MGLSASVARMLAVTARMSDIEFEGQQINQQRLGLSNDMSKIINEQYMLEVATPPSTQDCTKRVYSYHSPDGLTNFTLGSIIPEAGGNYTVNLEYKDHGDSIEEEGAVRIYRDPDEPSTYQVIVGNERLNIYEYNSTNAAGQGGPLESNSPRYQAAFNHYDPETYPYSGEHVDMSNVLVYFTSSQGSSIQNPHFLISSDVSSATYSSNDHTAMVTSLDYVANGSFTTSVTHTNVPIEFSNDGYIYSLTLTTNGVAKEYILTTETTFDENKYNDLMNEYNYKKAAYDKKVDDLNKKMTDIQAKDKKLELALKDLDMSRNALNTEIESLKKVIQDATDKGFKTFGG